jgi:hypothetical protein
MIDPNRWVIPRWVALLLAAAVLAMASAPDVAFAQGFGSFISPGELTRDHKELDGIANCNGCHAPGRGPAPDRCMKCHDRVRSQVATKSGYHGRKGRGTACETCHAEHNGRTHELVPNLSVDPKFDHFADVGWLLEGEHGRTRCIDCHPTQRVYHGQSTECVSCHQDPHGSENSSRDVLEDCESCHDAVDWDALPLSETVFDHTNREDADYLLEGQHVEVGCEDCHFEMKFVPIPFEKCTSCHVNSHRAAFRERECESCHPDSDTWDVPGFDHNLTKYKLEGEHVSVTCVECHPGDKTDPIAYQTCESCHFDLHKSQFDPRPCHECHAVTVAAFAMRDYDHDQTDYPLVGKHVEQDCEECHDDREKAVYVDLPHADCDECHEDAHDGSYEPTDCQVCHISDGFEIDAFDHDRTDFPHRGQHIGLECEKCHVAGRWNGVAHESCLDCHHTKVPHRPVITSEQCDDCHQETGFEFVTFDHVGETEFDLAPAHDELRCTACHTQVYDFLGLDSNCAVCHVDDRPWGHYDGDCGECHEAENWFPAGLGSNDHEVTGFALVGAHSLEPCESCHPVGQARGDAESQCVSCHSQDDPHMAMLGTLCADCHSEMSWLRTSWRHTTTGWPLRGAHRLAACVDCHATGYVGAPTECFRCHEVDAAACTSGCCVEAHASGGFDQCDSCHRVYAWSPVPATAYPHCSN